MSSFINTPKHFSTIKNNLSKLIFYSNNNFYLPYTMRETHLKIYNKSYFLDKREESLFNEIDTFAELQALCVNLQYKHHSEDLDADIQQSIKEVKTIVETKRISNTALLKLISCALYQVETEHLKELRDLSYGEKRALKFMQDIRTALMEHIVMNGKEWNDAEYSI